ncbi:exodeoxyribonuclease VII large subunit [Candidatus Omnitrophota bacterium]
MENSLPVDKTYTILELNTTVRNLIKGHFTTYIWVCGEIQGLRPDRNKKHTYFELVQKHAQSPEIAAKVKVALFAGRKPLIDERIAKSQGAFELKNDIEVKFLCEVSLHPPTGQYSLIIIDIDPVYTLGKVAQNRLKIIAELRGQGLLEKNRTLPIPDLPLRIGLITALDSAAYHDFINELNASGFGFKVTAVNSYMQGKGVEGDVIGALKYFNRIKADLDLVVITRGGGSKADLAWFDNQKIAQAIAHLPLPVLSALGHQTDISVTDMVAHTAFKTPTKAGQFLTERIAEALQAIEMLGEKILEGSLSYLQRQKQDLRTKTLVIDSGTLRYFGDHREDLARITSGLKSAGLQTLKDSARLADHNIKTVQDYSKRALQEAANNVKYIEDKLGLLDPRTILRRGYSITLKGSKAVRAISELTPGDIITTRYSHGRSHSQVKELNNDD